MDPSYIKIKELASKEFSINEIEVRELIRLITALTKQTLISGGYNPLDTVKLITKLRDAGRRSPPWNPFSKRMPGRPQDGADGNRRLRWLFETDHKYFATEIDATLVEIKYYLEILSMNDAPPIDDPSLQDKFIWLTGHQIIPGAYLDPIQLTPISLKTILMDLKQIHSGHFVPLDRGGRHEPTNTFLILARSNQIQGNQTLEELLDLMKEILDRHAAIKN